MPGPPSEPATAPPVARTAGAYFCAFTQSVKDSSP
jgi:hypothetical protein